MFHKLCSLIINFLKFKSGMVRFEIMLFIFYELDYINDLCLRRFINIINKLVKSKYDINSLVQFVKNNNQRTTLVKCNDEILSSQILDENTNELKQFHTLKMNICVVH